MQPHTLVSDCVNSSICCCVNLSWKCRWRRSDKCCQHHYHNKGSHYKRSLCAPALLSSYMTDTHNFYFASLNEQNGFKSALK